MGVRLYHPILDRTIEVSERRAERMARHGWRQFHSETRAVIEPDPSLIHGGVASPSVAFERDPDEVVIPLAEIPAEEADQPTPSKED